MTLYSIRMIWAERPPEMKRHILEEVLEPFGISLSSFEIGKGWQIEVIAERKPDFAKVTQAVAGLTRIKPVIGPLPEKDWVSESEKGLEPISTDAFFIHGAHFKGSLPKGKKSFQIDAGMAFGTGRHETTKLCLMALHTLSRTLPKAPQRILDLGTGTGILAFAAAHLFQTEVLAADNDKDAVRIAKENAAINGLAKKIHVLHSEGYRSPILKSQGPFDLVVANILANPLIEMAEDLSRNLAPKGLAILSGLMRDQEEAVLAAHGKLQLLEKKRNGKWSALLLQKQDKKKA